MASKWFESYHYSSWLKNKLPQDRWYNVYLVDALYWSRKSHDPQTQCGCVFTAPDNTPISHGYNGFIRDIDDSTLPRTRPDKYPYMIHAEANAIYNALRQGKSTTGAIAYVTSEPCHICLQAMYQCGIREVYYSNFSKPKMIDEDHQKASDIIRKLIEGKMDLYFVDKKLINGSYLEECLEIIGRQDNE